MKITDLVVYKIPPRWLFLKIVTDEGIVGWGEPIVEGRASTVKAFINDVKNQLIGMDPSRIEDIWQILYRGGFYRGSSEHMSVIAGVDQALWDIKGKFFNTPIYNLIGGACKDKIQVYKWIYGDTPEELAQSARTAIKEGYKAVKTLATDQCNYIDSYKKVDRVVERIGAVRSEVGSELEVGVDFHGRAHKAMARNLITELNQFNLMFVEEPLPPQNEDSLKDIRLYAHMPIALGERLFSRWDFKKVLEQGYADILQPDLSHAGGITEVKKIAAMAECYDVALAPHCPLGAVALASCVQIDVSCPNSIIQEQSVGLHYADKFRSKGNPLTDYLKNPDVFKYVDGYIEIPQGPGLGIQVNEEVISEKSKEFKTDWKNPIWRNLDGSICEW